MDCLEGAEKYMGISPNETPAPKMGGVGTFFKGRWIEWSFLERQNSQRNSCAHFIWV